MLVEDTSMDTDDLEPTLELPQIRDLKVMSIEALRIFVSELQSEIIRVEIEIELKKKARQGADKAFK